MAIAGSGALLLALGFYRTGREQPLAPALSPEGTVESAPAARASGDTLPATVRAPRVQTVQARAVRDRPAETPKTPQQSPSRVNDGAESIREARRERARAELRQLSQQNPRNFLRIFEIMKSQQRGDPGALAGLERKTHEYIAARARILERVLVRFIDDPDADHSTGLEELTRLQAEYRRELEWIARSVPDVENFDAILTTTTLKLPSFLEPPGADRPGERPSLALGPSPREFDPMNRAGASAPSAEPSHDQPPVPPEQEGEPRP
jgi:hypothetical protein